jgi:hypothetical protein
MFQPDIVVLAGTAEAITAVMNPLETAWPAAAPRPQYVLIDSVKVPNLLTSAATNPDLRSRVRGTGLTPGTASTSVLNAFNLDYIARYGMPTTASGVGPSYDATYAIAYALAATKDLPVSGANIAKGLRKLAGGATPIEVGGSKVLSAFSKLGAGENISAIGTFVPLEWDDRGAVVGGTIEMWCIGVPAGAPAYGSSGLKYDIKTGMVSGEFKPCQ